MQPIAAPPPSDGHEPWLVGIGASAGGLEPLRTIVRSLDPSLPAAVLVVMHLRAARSSTLTQQLRWVARIPVVPASDGARLRAGTVYVCPPNRHLEVHDGTLALGLGPAENGYRPAIDVLFRSLAAVAPTRTVAAVLSGALEDGTAGALAVADGGGHVVVQDPREAGVASMPLHVIAAVPDAASLPAEEMAAWIDATVRGGNPGNEAAISGWARPSPELAGEAGGQAAGGGTGRKTVDPDDPQGFACPDCGGVLEPTGDPRYLAFECRVGHRWGADGLADAQAQVLEAGLWQALRVLEEQIDLDRRLVARAAEAGRQAARVRLEERIASREAAAATIRAVLPSVLAGDLDDDAVPDGTPTGTAGGWALS